MSLVHYCVICLNGRFGFVPFTHLFTRFDDKNENKTGAQPNAPDVADKTSNVDIYDYKLLYTVN